MPFVSKAQQRWMFANHPRMAKRWAEHTPDIKSLPERVSKSRGAKGKSCGAKGPAKAPAKTETRPVDFRALCKAARLTWTGLRRLWQPPLGQKQAAAFIASLLAERRAAIKEAFATPPVTRPRSWSAMPVERAKRILLGFMPPPRLRPKMAGPGSQALRVPNVIGAFGPLGGRDVTNGAQNVRANYRWA